MDGRIDQGLEYLSDVHARRWAMAVVGSGASALAGLIAGIGYLGVNSVIL